MVKFFFFFLGVIVQREVCACDLQRSFGGFARHCIESFVDKRGDWIAAHNSLWLFSRGVSDLGMENGGKSAVLQIYPHLKEKE